MFNVGFSSQQEIENVFFAVVYPESLSKYPTGYHQTLPLIMDALGSGQISKCSIMGPKNLILIIKAPIVRSKVLSARYGIFQHPPNRRIEVSCELCWEDFDDGDHTPLVSKCGHTFCKACVASPHLARVFAHSMRVVKGMAAESIRLSLNPKRSTRPKP